MNFKEFQNHVHEMHIDLNNKGVPLDLVEIIHTKSSGENIIAAVYNERVIYYFKW